MFQITIVTVMLIVAITIGVICRIQCQTISSSPMIPASPRTESEIHDKTLQSSYGELGPLTSNSRSFIHPARPPCLQHLVMSPTASKSLPRAVVVVKWSACSPSTLAIQVRIPRKPKVFSVNLCMKTIKINKKEAGVVPFFLKKEFTY